MERDKLFKTRNSEVKKQIEQTKKNQVTWPATFEREKERKLNVCLGSENWKKKTKDWNKT